MNHFITYLWRVNHCVIVQATCMYNAVRITKKGVSRGIRNARCGFDEQEGRESSPLSFFWKKRGRLIFSCCCFCLCRGQNKGWLRQPAGSRGIYFEAALLREELQHIVQFFCWFGRRYYHYLRLLLPASIYRNPSCFWQGFFYVKLITPKKKEILENSFKSTWSFGR